VNFRPYTSPGARIPPFAHKAPLSEDKIGTMLPCEIVVQEVAAGQIEVSAVDPVASMSAVGDADLAGIANRQNRTLARSGRRESPVKPPTRVTLSLLALKSLTIWAYSYSDRDRASCET